MRGAARRADWDVIAKEKASEQAERLATGKRPREASFFERRRIRKEEKQKEKQMRAATRAEANTIRVQERRDEEKLGQTTPHGSEGRK